MAKTRAAVQKNPLSAAHEDYLKAIYLLSNQGQRVTNSALANYLDVSPASTTNMVKKLGEQKLVQYTPYRSITLTDQGEQVALEVLRHHRLLELYLHDKLNLSWDQVHEEAERLEHVMSEALEEAIAAALDNPTIDPHGDPIPTRDGYVEQIDGEPLSAATPDRVYRLVRVLLQDSDRLCYLGTLGLYPNTEIMFHKRAPFNGPLLVEIDGEHHALAYDMAESLLVTDIS